MCFTCERECSQQKRSISFAPNKYKPPLLKQKSSIKKSNIDEFYIKTSVLHISSHRKIYLNLKDLTNTPLLAAGISNTR